MKFSLVHPSRGRVALAEEAVREWAAKRSGRHACEHILSIDTDDPAGPGYRDLAARLGLRLTANANRTMVEAMNRGAALADGDVIVAISDDFGSPDQWDVEIAALLQNHPRAALLVHDGIDGRIMTLPVLTRAYFAELGYVYHPAYRSMYADDDLTTVARHGGALVDARHLVFPHRHHSVGLCAEDATYAKQDGGAAWWHGWRAFEKRRLVDFGARPDDWRVRLARARIDAYYWLRLVGSAARRRWLPRLGPAGRAREARLRALALRLLGRITAMRGLEA